MVACLEPRLRNHRNGALIFQNLPYPTLTARPAYCREPEASSPPCPIHIGADRRVRVGQQLGEDRDPLRYRQPSQIVRMIEPIPRAALAVLDPKIFRRGTAPRLARGVNLH